MTRRGFLMIFWGLPFVLLDAQTYYINIILSDVIGYILIALGLNTLSSLDPRFKKVKPLAIIMIVLSLTELVPPKMMTGLGIPLLLSTILGTVLFLIIIWQICGGIIELANAADKLELAEKADARRKLYLLLALLGFCRIGLLWLGPDLAQAMVIPLLVFQVFTLVVLGLLMGLMRRAAREISVETPPVEQIDSSAPGNA